MFLKSLVLAAALSATFASTAFAQEAQQYYRDPATGSVVQLNNDMPLPSNPPYRPGMVWACTKGADGVWRNCAYRWAPDAAYGQQYGGQYQTPYYRGPTIGDALVLGGLCALTGCFDHHRGYGGYRHYRRGW